MSFSKHRRVWTAFCSWSRGRGCVWAGSWKNNNSPCGNKAVLQRVVCTHFVCQQLRGSDSLLSWGSVCKGMANLLWPFHYFLLKDSRDRSGEGYQGQKQDIAKSMIYLFWCPQKTPKKPKPKKPMWPAYLKSMLTIRKLTISSLAWKTLIQTINPDLHCKEALLIFMWKIEGDSS